jgi:hypothetical protein
VTPDRRDALRKELRALILDGAPALDGAIADHAPLITSGLVESTTLVSVAMWVEDHVGGEVQLGAFDLVQEWDSLNAILDFVERHAQPAGSSPP